MDVDSILTFAESIRNCKGNIFVFGNGGSSATASHLAVDLTKGCEIPTICLNDSVPILTAYSNDISYSMAFSKYIEVMGKKGDVAIGISGSGESDNVVCGLIRAKQMGITTLSLTGNKGGRALFNSDFGIVVDSMDMQEIEDSHMVIVHILYRLLK